MRAVACTVPGCLHIHAENDDALVQLLLRHTHQAHPEKRLGEQAAEALVDDSGYEDKRHAKRQGFASTLRNDVGGGFPPWL